MPLEGTMELQLVRSLCCLLVFLLQASSSTKTCTLVRSNEKTSEDCFSEPECEEKCGEVKGDNCKEQQGKQCRTEYKEQCRVVEVEVRDVFIAIDIIYLCVPRNVERRQKLFVKPSLRICVMLVRVVLLRFALFYLLLLQLKCLSARLAMRKHVRS